MSILPIVLACPPPDHVMWLYRLEELVMTLAVLFPATLLLVGSIAVGIHSARLGSR